MKRIDLIPLIQKGETFWILKEDPRKIVKLLNNINAGEQQEAQRPWIKKKVEEISEYVGGKIKFQGVTLNCKGILPSAPILDLHGELEVKNDENGAYIEFPESNEEFERLSGKVDIIDGQHRILSFMEEYRDINLKDTDTYEMMFFVFNSLTKKEKQELFLIINEKQEGISKNLLRRMKKWLGLLENEDEEIFDLVVGLNTENISPIKGKIVIGEDKVTNGWKEGQVSRVLDKTGTFKKLKTLDADVAIKIVSNYLKAWEEVYGAPFSDGGYTMTKISGFRYIMYYFPVIYDVLGEARAVASKENFVTYVKFTLEATGGNSVFETQRDIFKGEGATIKNVTDHIAKYNQIIARELKKFDPSTGV